MKRDKTIIHKQYEIQSNKLKKSKLIKQSIFFEFQQIKQYK